MDTNGSLKARLARLEPPPVVPDGVAKRTREIEGLFRHLATLSHEEREERRKAELEWYKNYLEGREEHQDE